MMTFFSNNKVRIVSAFLSVPGQARYARELERLCKLDIKIISRELPDLVKNNILDYEKRGKQKFFFLKQSTEAEAMLCAAEHYRKLLFLEENKHLKAPLTELSKECEFAIFGSFASGTNNPKSDIDLVIFTKQVKNIRKFFERLNISAHIQQASFDEFKKMLAENKPLAVEIAKNHLLFGKESDFSKMMLQWISSNGALTRIKGLG